MKGENPFKKGVLNVKRCELFVEFKINKIQRMKGLIVALFLLMVLGEGNLIR